jgi:hypothetical protein
MFAKFSCERHLNVQEMILLGDGELSRYRTRMARRHLEHCWSCRSQFDAVQGVIVAFVQHCDSITDGLGPAPNWQRKVSALESKSRSNRRPVQWKPPAFAAVALSVSIIGVLFYDGTVTTARAAEILHQAKSREYKKRQAIPNAVIHQRLQVTANARRAEWTSTRGPQGQQLESSWKGDETLKADFLRIYDRSGLNRGVPLSPAAFLDWQSDTHARTSAVRENGDGTITILLSAEGVIQESSLTLSQPELHATAETMVVRTESGSQNFEIRELSYALVPLSESTVVDGHVKNAPAPAAPLSHALRWNDAELEYAEASARLLLHERRAEVRFEPQIARRDGAVLVRMIVENDRERDEWREALAPIAGVIAEIWTPETVPPASVDLDEADSIQPHTLYRSSAPMADELARCLGSNAKAAAFIDEFHSEVRAALVPALALERLSSRYASAGTADRPEVEEKLRRIATDDWADADRQVARVVAMVNPAFGQCFWSEEEVPAGGEP